MGRIDTLVVRIDTVMSQCDTLVVGIEAVMGATAWRRVF